MLAALAGPVSLAQNEKAPAGGQPGKGPLTILGDVAEYVREKLSKSYAKPLARGRLPVELRQFEPKPEGEF